MVVWCDRCDRSYRTHYAFRQHIRDSLRHYECPKCDFDGSSWDDLLGHCRDSGCREVCQGCDDGEGEHWAPDSEEYLQHVDDCNVCTDCEKHFTTPSHLYQHRLSHRTANFNCYECDRGFKTYGGMIIHLEYGNCGGIDHTDLNKIAAGCRKWRYFIYEDYHDDLLHYGDAEYRHGKVNPYLCPTCDTAVPKLSSLFQHIESSSCDQTLTDNVIGKLRNFLASRLR